MSYDPQSPSDRADMEPDDVLICEFCDEQIDESDVSIEAFEASCCPICKTCFDKLCDYAATAFEDEIDGRVG